MDPKLLVKCLLKVAEWKRDDIAHGRTAVSAAFTTTAISAVNESGRGGGGGRRSNSVSAPPSSGIGSGTGAAPVTSALGEVLNLLARAKACRPHMYAAWHAWALTNHEAVKLAQRAHTDSTSATAKHATGNSNENMSSGGDNSADDSSIVMAPLGSSSSPGAGTSFTYESVVAHVTSAISGFVRAIALGQAHSVANVLQVR